MQFGLFEEPIRKSIKISVKKEVYKRANGRCENPKCRKKLPPSGGGPPKAPPSGGGPPKAPPGGGPPKAPTFAKRPVAPGAPPGGGPPSAGPPKTPGAPAAAPQAGGGLSSLRDEMLDELNRLKKIMRGE